MTLTDEQAQAVVDACLNTLWQRRPFKWDLGEMKYGKRGGHEGEETELWKEMMEDMREDVKTVLGYLPP